MVNFAGATLKLSKTIRQQTVGYTRNENFDVQLRGKNGGENSLNIKPNFIIDSGPVSRLTILSPLLLKKEPHFTIIIYSPTNVSASHLPNG